MHYGTLDEQSTTVNLKEEEWAEMMALEQEIKFQE